jgi:large subunit ribosomal protein L19e
MNLRTKKELAARALKVGKERIAFVGERREEIKEAITKQDIKDLYKDGAIKIKEVKGRKTKIIKRNRSPGNVRKKVNTRKRDYVIMTRKLRAYVKALRGKGELSVEEAKDIRKKIRNKVFKSKANLRDYIGGLRK